ncbi:MAG TPA: SRPBCC domain-containing protein, partial [Acidimicrobiales bacterium]|nr:SRPBCC domain-containing protein [Acidimicrobiales bacterium]
MKASDYEKAVIVHASPDAVFDALITTSGLTAWWSPVTGSGEAGGELRFAMNAPEPCVMRVDVASRPALVQWTCISCDFMPDWVGTRPTYTIIPLDDGTTELRFRHIGLTS